ncbi:condensation domain-containing protein [Streptomyces sp. NPDC093586]|uniref:condensation domain-containing protein n=1 Tax=Streptomyces sp. NPDC093586 TaxID=3366042 RepID=UPI0038049E0A
MTHTDPGNGALPLSVGQEGLWLLHSLAPDSSTYHLAGGVRMEPAPDPEILARAVDAVTERHPMLRSVYADTEAGPRRRVLPPGATGRLTVREVPGADDAELRRTVDAEVAVPFRLTEEGPLRAVLLRRGPDAVLLVVTHHIATDALSQWLLWRDLLAAYADLAAGRTPRLEPPATDFDHFVEAERTLLDSSRGARQADYWREQCAGSQAAELPTDRPRPAGPAGKGASLVRRLPDALSERIRRGAAEQEVSQFAVALGALQALVNRWTGMRDFLIACPASVRRSAAREVVGYYVNPVLIRAEITRNATLREVVDRAADRIRQATARASYPFPLVARDAGEAGPLYRISMTMVATDRFDGGMEVAAAGVPIQVGDLTVTYLEISHLEGQCDVSLEVTRDANGLTIALRYDTELFERPTMERLFDQYIRFLAAAVDDADRPVGRVPLTDGDDKRALLALGGHPGAVS